MTNWVVGAGHALATRQRVFQPPATLDLGNDPVLAAQVVTVRDSAGGFSSAEEMAILTDLPPHVVDQVRDRLVFSPR